MARQTNAAYWAQRMKNMEDALLDQSYSYVENLEKQFAAAQAEIERQMARWYQRFATNNEIDLAEAKRLLNSKELKELDRKSTRLNSSHVALSRMPSSA